MYHILIFVENRNKIFFTFFQAFIGHFKKKFFSELKNLGYELELQPFSFILRLFLGGEGAWDAPSSRQYKDSNPQLL